MENGTTPLDFPHPLVRFGHAANALMQAELLHHIHRSTASSHHQRAYLPLVERSQRRPHQKKLTHTEHKSRTASIKERRLAYFILVINMSTSHQQHLQQVHCSLLLGSRKSFDLIHAWINTQHEWFD
jgi:hypothetical protein